MSRATYKVDTVTNQRKILELASQGFKIEDDTHVSFPSTIIAQEVLPNFTAFGKKENDTEFLPLALYDKSRNEWTSLNFEPSCADEKATDQKEAVAKPKPKTSVRLSMSFHQTSFKLFRPDVDEMVKWAQSLDVDNVELDINIK